LNTSPNIIRVIKSRRMRSEGHIAHRPEGKRPLGRPRRRWEDIRMDLRGIGWKGVDWIHLAQDTEHWRAVVIMEMNLPVP
jgi:hypothetical protein